MKIDYDGLFEKPTVRRTPEIAKIEGKAYFVDEEHGYLRVTPKETIVQMVMMFLVNDLWVRKALLRTHVPLRFYDWDEQDTVDIVLDHPNTLERRKTAPLCIVACGDLTRDIDDALIMQMHGCRTITCCSHAAITNGDETTYLHYSEATGGYDIIDFMEEFLMMPEKAAEQPPVALPKW